MQLSTAFVLLTAAIPSVQAGKWTGDGHSGTCLNALYQKFHPNTTLQCSSTSRFWTKISAEANSQCVVGRTLHVKNLSFESTFDWSAYDFNVVIATSTEFDEGIDVQYKNPYLMPLYGKECLVHTLDETEGSDVDGDSCYDVALLGHRGKVDEISTTVTIPSVTIPCVGGEGGNTVQIQFCSSWRSAEENINCDVEGVGPDGFEGCACEVVDLGVEIVGPEDAKPTCEPSMLTETPTYYEGPTIPNGKPVPTPEPTLEPTPETPVPTPAPFVINVTSKPSSLIVATPSPVATDSKVATTCKNNAVITSITESGTLDITSQASHGTCAVLYDTSIIYYPIPGFIGSDKCEYSLCVSNESTGEFECSEGVLEVSVVDCPLVVSPTPKPTPSPTESPVTDTPTESPTCDYATIDANNNEVTTPINTPIDIQVLENDVAIDGLPLDITAILFPGNDGVCTITDEGKVINYTPNEDYFGTDKCIYTACDEEGHCDSATVIIHVVPTDAAVIANDDKVSTNITTPVDIFALENDVAVDGHPLTITKIESNAASGDCVIVSSNTVVMYIPEPDFVGEDSCVYEACDDRGVCDEATITIDVNGNPCDDKATEPEDAPTTLKPTTPSFAWVPTTKAPVSLSPVSSSPTVSPSESPSTSPTKAPVSSAPVSSAPTASPTASPSVSPSDKPSAKPTEKPSPSPSDKPTPSPSESPSASPSASPSGSPSASPSAKPTPLPTPLPTPSPSDSPSASPTPLPTPLPTPVPTPLPTPLPTPVPSQEPTSSSPTKKPVLTWTVATRAPITPITPEPSAEPTKKPTLTWVIATRKPVAPVTDTPAPTEEPTPAPVEATKSPECAPGPLSPIDIEGKKPTSEPTPVPFATSAPTICNDRGWFFYMGKCTNTVWSNGAPSYDSAAECCDANVAIGSLENGRCVTDDLCTYPDPPTESPTYGFVVDTLPPTAGVPITPDGTGKTIPPTPSPSELSTTISPTPSPSESSTTISPTPSPSESSTTISPTPSPSLIVVKTYAPTPFPTDSTPEPTFGSTPTVGTSATLAPVRERGGD